MDDEIRIFFGRSKIRMSVLKELKSKPQIASFLARKIKKHREVVSQIFLDMKKKNLVECVNPDQSNFRAYKLTNKGRKVLREFESGNF